MCFVLVVLVSQKHPLPCTSCTSSKPSPVKSRVFTSTGRVLVCTSWVFRVLVGKPPYFLPIPLYYITYYIIMYLYTYIRSYIIFYIICYVIYYINININYYINYYITLYISINININITYYIICYITLNITLYINVYITQTIHPHRNNTAKSSYFITTLNPPKTLVPSIFQWYYKIIPIGRAYP